MIQKYCVDCNHRNCAILRQLHKLMPDPDDNEVKVSFMDTHNNKKEINFSTAEEGVNYMIKIKEYGYKNILILPLNHRVETI